MVKLGIIGGSGAKGVIQSLGLEATIETAHVLSANVDYLHFHHQDTEVYFILRHGQDHTDLPAKLDQRGIITFLQHQGVGEVILTSATGSLDTSIPLVDEGGMVINSGTFRGFGYHGISFNNPQNPHAVLASPYDSTLRKLLLDSAPEVPGLKAFDGGLYIQNEGNSFESPAEIADLYCRLDAPSARVRILSNLLGLTPSSSLPTSVKLESIDSLNQEIEVYQRLSKHLNVRYAQVSMNAVRETILGLEAGLKIALVSFPVNYGAGLVPEEQVDHNRTMNAIAKATEPYIVPFLRQVIENAPKYLKAA